MQLIEITRAGFDVLVSQLHTVHWQQSVQPEQRLRGSYPVACSVSGLESSNNPTSVEMLLVQAEAAALYRDEAYPDVIGRHLRDRRGRAAAGQLLELCALALQMIILL